MTLKINIEEVVYKLLFFQSKHRIILPYIKHNDYIFISNEDSNIILNIYEYFISLNYICNKKSYNNTHLLYIFPEKVELNVLQITSLYKLIDEYFIYEIYGSTKDIVYWLEDNNYDITYEELQTYELLVNLEEDSNKYKLKTIHSNDIGIFKNEPLYKYIIYEKEDIIISNRNYYKYRYKTFIDDTYLFINCTSINKNKARYLLSTLFKTKYINTVINNNLK